ncbi:MAG: glucosamine-6-phosphate deaminase [Candidatus Nephrothrix sp. EaCA]|nr:MAG: glucosamine-6-phosphate deaminase [Candidatus Nephrothrix sp. EaCA]
MKIYLLRNKAIQGKCAAKQAAAVIKQAIAQRGEARILSATGESQFEFLQALVQESDIDWAKTEMFHLDEYVGLPMSHPASFRKYLMERFIGKTGIKKYHLLDGETNPEETCRRMGELISAAPIDVAFTGIGENGHLAFNDPPADFDTEEPYLIVKLDEACRKQQVGEGWFKTLTEVPERAISISVRQLLKAKSILTIVPDTRKAAAVQRCLEEPVSPMTPASILRTHPNVILYLDPNSASLLKEKPEATEDVPAML